MDNDDVFKENKLILDAAKANPGMELKLSSIIAEAESRSSEFQIKEGDVITPENLSNIQHPVVLESDYDFQLSLAEDLTVSDVVDEKVQDVEVSFEEDPTLISPVLKDLVDHVSSVNSRELFETDDKMKMDAINLLGNSISSFFLPLTKDQLSYIDDGLLELEVNISEFNNYVFAVLDNLGMPAVAMRSFDWKVFFDSFVAFKVGLEDLCALMVDFGDPENIRRGQRIIRNNWRGKDLRYINYLRRLFKVTVE